MVLGQVAGSCIPGMDIRDVIANCKNEDYKMAALSGIGLVPVAGDAFKAAKTVGKFGLKNADKLDEVANLLEIINKNLDDVAGALSKSDEFIEAAKQLTKMDDVKLTREQAEAVMEALKKAGLTKYLDEATNPWLRRLAGGNINPLNGLPVNQGYDSFGHLKAAIGSAGEGKQWHHIVEQSQIGRSGFSAQKIHNTSNIIAVDQAIHAKITGYYNTKSFDFTDGLSVRDWLAGQSYEYQYEFGLDVLRQYGVID